MIYDLDVKGMRKMIRKFSRTAYGRTVFTLAYAAFFFFLILTFLLKVFDKKDYSVIIIDTLIGTVVL